MLRSNEVTVARIAYAELAASVARACRLGAITEAQRNTILLRLSANLFLTANHCWRVLDQEGERDRFYVGH